MKAQKQEKKYLNTKEACDYLGIKEEETLYEYIKSGSLKAYKLGKGERTHWRFTVKGLDAFVKLGMR